MEICFHTNFEITPNYIGGTERFLIKISKELKALGHDPFIVCSRLDEEIYIEGIKVIGCIPSKYKRPFEKYSFFSSSFLKNEIIGKQFSVDSLKRLSDYTAEQLSGIKSDVFHLNSFASASFLKPEGNYFVTNHENEREYDGYWGVGFFNMMSSLVHSRKSQLHNYKRLITPSNYYAKEFSRLFNLPVVGINLGVHLEDFEYSIRKTTQSKESEVRILLPSRFQTKQKGHDIAIMACSILKQKNIPFKMIFSGMKKSTEKYLPDFLRLAELYNVQDCVTITSFADIRTAYENCDIVISPEKYCSYGLSISESLALGIPTILSDIPTYKEIASGYKHAFFFESESPEDLASKIIDLIPRKTERYTNDAIRFRTNYDLRNCARKYSQLYFA